MPTSGKGGNLGSQQSGAPTFSPNDVVEKKTNIEQANIEAEDAVNQAVLKTVQGVDETTKAIMGDGTSQVDTSASQSEAEAAVSAAVNSGAS